MKIGEVYENTVLGTLPFKVTAIQPDGRVELTTYLWPYDFRISDEEKAKRKAAIYG